ncbi:hypothetical protein ACIBCT_07555 [Streptosporangium sp. NPDC050855]|uniref:hypothetical protein n=1 Tax=Streptosporangium sp. NPDC050855 TaxID=3366194 RepID=UPI0037B529C5
MALVDRDDVRELLGSPDPDATLVYVEGACRVVPADRVEGLSVVSRRELQEQLGEDAAGGGLSDERLDELAHRLDTVVRELGG